MCPRLRSPAQLKHLITQIQWPVRKHTHIDIRKIRTSPQKQEVVQASAHGYMDLCSELPSEYTAGQICPTKTRVIGPSE